MSVHQHYLLSIQAGQDFLDLFLHFLVFFFQGIDPFILSCIVGFDSRDFCSLVMDGLCHFGLADAVICGAFANLEGDAGIEARVTVAKGNAHVDHGVGVRLVEGADSGCVGVMVMAIADGEACFISRVEIKRMEGCQSIAAGCGSVDVRIQTAVSVVHVAVNLLCIGSREAIDVTDVSCAVRVVSITDDTGDDAACRIAIGILAADIYLRSRAVATNLDGITLVIRVDEVARRLEARVQSRQVLTDGVAALDVRAILVDMDFLVERVTRNQARIARNDLCLQH